jgi:LPXTG-motif cell wall-anchored protein
MLAATGTGSPHGVAYALAFVLVGATMVGLTRRRRGAAR